MGMDFGTFVSPTKKVCYDAPNEKYQKANIKAPSLGGALPDLPGFNKGFLNFGKNLGDEISTFGQSVKDKLNNIGGQSVKVPLFPKFSFEDMDKRLKDQKAQTVCLNIGGGIGLNELLHNLGDILNKIQAPTITLPKLGDLAFAPLSGLLPTLSLIPTLLPCSVPLTSILQKIAERCANLLIANLDGLDPFAKLLQLLDRLQQLCGLMQFSKIREIVDQIEAARNDLIRGIIDKLTSPFEKLTKLYDMACDALTAGATDVMDAISGLAQQISFENLLDQLSNLDPRTAIASLMSEIRQQAQLKNFGAIRRLLDAINIIKAQSADISSLVDNLLSTPENLLDILQDKINQALDLENFDLLNQLLNQFEGLQDNVISNLRNLDPSRLLTEGSTLLNDALSKLDMSRFNRILDEMANGLCAEGTQFLPKIPDVPAVNPGAIPSFLL